MTHSNGGDTPVRCNPKLISGVFGGQREQNDENKP